MQKKSILFFQDWGTYPITTLVSVNNENYDELMDMIDKKNDKEWYKAIKDRYESSTELSDIEKHNHFTKWTAQDGKKYSVLFIKSWEWKTLDYIILAHELIHAVSFCMSEMMDLIKENEAMAYQHSYLMEMIITRLDKHKGKSLLH